MKTLRKIKGLSTHLILAALGILFAIVGTYFVSVPNAQAQGFVRPAPGLKSEKVVLAGSMNVIWSETTSIMSIVADYTPVGKGTAVLVRSDVLADAETEDGVRAVFTDNMKFVEYLQEVVFNEIPLFGRPGSERSVPVHEATINNSGDGRSQITTKVLSDDMKIEIKWSDLEAPVVVTSAPRSFGPPFYINGMMLPAKSFQVLINGTEVKGKFESFGKGPEGCKTQIPPVFTLISTTWIQPDVPVPSKGRRGGSRPNRSEQQEEGQQEESQ